MSKNTTSAEPDSIVSPTTSTGTERDAGGKRRRAWSNADLCWVVVSKRSTETPEPGIERCKVAVESSKPVGEI